MFSRIVLMTVLSLWATPCSKESEEPSRSEVETRQFKLSLWDTDYSMVRTRIYHLTNDQLSITVGGLQRDRPFDLNEAPAGSETELQLHLVPTVGGGGFGLQAEVFRFRAIQLEAPSSHLARSTAAWRP